MTPQLQELLAAGLAFSIRYKTDMANDGKISWLEMAGFFNDIGLDREALEGADQIPKELLALTETDLVEIVPELSAILTAWGVPHRPQDITADMIQGVVIMMPTAKLLVSQFQDMLAKIEAQPVAAEAV